MTSVGVGGTDIVQDLESMQYLMRYNKFQTDSYANGDPWAVRATVVASVWSHTGLPSPGADDDAWHATTRR